MSVNTPDKSPLNWQVYCTKSACLAEGNDLSVVILGKY